MSRFAPMPAIANMSAALPTTSCGLSHTSHLLQCFVDFHVGVDLNRLTVDLDDAPHVRVAWHTTGMLMSH